MVDLKRLTVFTFKREASWLAVVCILLPLLAILLAIVVPVLMRAL